MGEENEKIEEKKVEDEKVVKKKLNVSPLNLLLFIILLAALLSILIFSITDLYNRTRVNQDVNAMNNTTVTEEECNNIIYSYNDTTNTHSVTWNTISIPDVAYKPIIYIYPTGTIELSVKLGRPENITCSYPDYKDGWNVIANPDGTLIDKDTGRSLYALYWEGLRTKNVTFDDGFVVEGKDTIEFLEEKLAILGLNEREAEEFIVYWLPKLQDNKYNLIRFASMDEINKNMPLEISKEPDTLIRVLMEYKALDEYEEVPGQMLEQAERTGFTVVEWGGTEVK